MKKSKTKKVKKLTLTERRNGVCHLVKEVIELQNQRRDQVSPLMSKMEVLTERRMKM